MLPVVEGREETRGLSGGPARRAARIAQVGARYGFGYVFGRRFLTGRQARDVGRIGTRLRLALGELGPTFVELGRALAARRDALPPDIARELARARAPVRAVPFSDVRALLERELENSLERLFVSLDERPVRTGPLTQSHRAVLPGDRPALVVVNRPGIRRDLLAMRPVADVVRRRLHSGADPGLPLDPGEAVNTFAATVGQRRDMYFAAQTARRLSGLEGLALRVPETYRRYSTARCATFEAPESWVPADGGALLAASGALVRLGLLEGIFFADLVPERFAVAGGEVWMLDPTEVFALDPERMRGLAEAWAGVGRGDVDAIVRSLPRFGGSTPSDVRVLQRELRDALGSLGGPLWPEHPLAQVRDRGLEALRRGGASLPDEVARLFDSLVAAEVLGTGRAEARARPGEEQPATVAAVHAAREAVERYRDPRRMARRAVERLAQTDAYADYPRQIHTLLGELKDGEIEVAFQHKGIDELISKVDVLANRLVFALLIAALLLGSAMLGIFADAPIRILGVTIFGLIGFVLAAALAVALLVGIIRSGRL